MRTLTICLFGKLQVQRGEQLLDSLNSGKVQELLAFLLIHRGHLHSREILASILWNKKTNTHTLKYLRQALWQLQAALGCADKTAADSPIVIDPEWVGFNAKADIWLDVAVFEQTYTQIRGVQGRTLDASSAQSLQQAVELYQGDLLEGWYQDWCLYERERLQNIYLIMLDKLMGYCEAHRAYETGLIYGMRALKYDRAREGIHRRLMRLNYLAGNRTAALRQYERCVAALDEELAVKPARRTVALYEQIRRDQVDGLTGGQTEASPTDTSTTSRLCDLLGQLKQLHTILTDVQHQVAHKIQTVEQTLDDEC